MPFNEVEPGAEILVVDDERFSRRILVRALEHAGFVCRQGGGGEEALGLVEEKLPALLLLDYAMPGGLNGAEVCERLRAHPDRAVAQLPVIMLTGMSGEEQEVFCLQAGASDFVTKPVNPAVLKARIDTQLRLSALRAQLEGRNRELADWRAELERDLEAARLTQQSIIPQNVPLLPGWDVATHYQPVIQVGGDIFDWLRLPDGRSFFWIADATGHGASAALHTALAKLLFRHAAAETSSPAEILRAVNRDYLATFKGRSLLTAMGVALDPGTGHVTTAGAGHPPLLLRRADGRTETVPSQCPPLGLTPQLAPADDTAALAEGDGFLLFTDGFYDMVDGAGERMDISAFERQVCAVTASTSAELLAGVLGSLHEFSDGTAFADDLAAVAVLRRPAS